MASAREGSCSPAGVRAGSRVARGFLHRGTDGVDMRVLVDTQSFLLRMCGVVLIELPWFGGCFLVPLGRVLSGIFAGKLGSLGEMGCVCGRVRGWAGLLLGMGDPEWNLPLPAIPGRPSLPPCFEQCERIPWPPDPTFIKPVSPEPEESRRFPAP